LLPNLRRDRPIGLIAGKGNFPRLLARAATDQGFRVEAFAIERVTDPELAEDVSAIHWLHLGQFGRLIEICHERRVETLAMAGAVPHTAIFRYRGFDPRSLKILSRAANLKADSILGAVTAELAREHIEVLDSTLFLRSLMPKRGLLTPRRRLSQSEKQDIRFGMPIAKEIGRLDIGQSVAVKDRAVVAVESLEGTDAMIQRAGRLAGPGCVICKVAKPEQDSRFDVPVIGLETVRAMVRASATVLAIEAGATLFFQQEEALRLAHGNRIAIFAGVVATAGPA